MKGFLLAGIVLLVVALIGWVMNIIAIVHSGAMSEWTGFVIVRVIGVIIAPLGAVLGYF